MRNREHYSRTGALYFYGGPFSSFAYRDIWLPPAYQGAKETEAEFYDCRETYFAASKARNRKDHDYVVEGARTSAWKVKERGREIPLRDDGWDEGISYRTMLTCVRHEVESHWDLADFLEHTGDRHIAEDSPTDFIWGIRDEGFGFTGRNLLGLCWMQARFEMRHGSRAAAVVAPHLVELRTRGVITNDDDLLAALQTLDVPALEIQHS